MTSLRKNVTPFLGNLCITQQPHESMDTNNSAGILERTRDKKGFGICYCADCNWKNSETDTVCVKRICIILDPRLDASFFRIFCSRAVRHSRSQPDCHQSQQPASQPASVQQCAQQKCARRKRVSINRGKLFPLLSTKKKK